MVAQDKTNLRVSAECPKPIIHQDLDTANYTDDDQDAAKETLFAGSTFHFLPGTQPSTENTVYETRDQRQICHGNDELQHAYFTCSRW